MSVRIFLLAAFTAVLTSYAHPGHDMMAHGAGHVATSVYHLWVLLGAAVAAFGVAQLVRNSTTRRVLRAAGVTTLIVAGAMWGFGI